MGETSVYFVPDAAESFSGRAREVAERFWDRGLFMDTSDDFVRRRLAEYQARGRPLPASAHSFSFLGMGIDDPGEPVPVPNRLWHLVCPHCNADVVDRAYEVWQESISTPIPERLVECRACKTQTASASLKSEEAFAFAAFYVWVSDIDEDDWEPSFKATVEDVIGPCREYRGWDT